MLIDAIFRTSIYFRKIAAPFTARYSNIEEVDKGKVTLANTNSIQIALDVRNAISKNEFLRISNSKVSPSDNILQISDVEYYSVQKLVLYLLCGNGLLRSLALASLNGGKLWFPLPKSWRNQFRIQGIRVNGTISTMMWASLVIFISSKSLIKGLRALRSTSSVKFEPHIPEDMDERIKVFLPTASELQLDGSGNDNNKQNFANWLSNEMFRDFKIHIYHSLPNHEGIEASNSKVTMSFLPTFQHGPYRDSKLKIICSLIVIIRRLVFKHPFKIPVVLINFSAIVESVVVESNLENISLDKIVFFNSNAILKPLWARTMERRGVEVIICFYALATNPQQEIVSRLSMGYWSVSSWECFWLIDEYQQKFFSDLILNGDVKFKVIGVPFWSDLGKNVTLPKANFVTLFDISIPENYSDLALITFERIFLIEHLRDFFLSVVEIATSLDFVVLHKQKHRFRERTSTNYQNLIMHLRENYPDVYHQVDSSVSPNRLVPLGFASISMPVSTTAVIAQNLRVPSIYFDPSNTFTESHLGLRGVQLTNSKSDLKAWLSSSLQQHKRGN